MGTSDTAPRWVHTHATYLAEGDRFRVVGQEFKVAERLPDDGWSMNFRVKLTDGTQMSMLRSSVVEVFDPDGSVSARVMEVTW